MSEGKPSISLRNVYYMLCYALTSLRPQAEEQKMAGEKFEHLHDLFAALLTMELERLLKRGLHREYLGCADESPMLRGRVDIPGSIRLQMTRQRLVACEYDELSVDNLFNRILKTTALLLLRHGEVPSRRREALKRLMPFLDGIGTVDVCRLCWDRLHYRRENRHYRLVMELCCFIAEEWLLTTENGEYKLASYLDEKRMNSLYEKFLRNFFRQECPGVQVSAPHIPWVVDSRSDKTQLPRMKSDIVLTCGERTLIIDAKWYTRNMQEYEGVCKLHSPHLYQISTYVNHYAEANPGQEVSGMLLYAKTSAPVQPNADIRMLRKRIRACTLDMGDDFESIKANLTSIARELQE